METDHSHPRYKQNHTSGKTSMFPSRVSGDPAPFGHCAPRHGIRSHRERLSPLGLHPPSLQKPTANPGCHVCFGQNGYRLDSPTSSSESANELERLTEFTETFHLLAQQLNTKGSATRKRWGGKAWGKRLGLCGLSGSCAHIPTWSPSWKLSESCLLGFFFFFLLS